jgi:hypothetical protein
MKTQGGVGDNAWWREALGSNYWHFSQVGVNNPFLNE